MNGSRPTRAPQLGLPVPRRPEAASELTQASDVLLDALLDLDGPDSSSPDSSSPDPAGPDLKAPALKASDVDGPDPVGEPSGGPAGDDRRQDISRTSAVWLWLWGPLVAVVLVVGFLGGMASAPVALPLPAQALPATVLDVTGRTVGTIEPPAPSEQLSTDQLPPLLTGAIVAVQDPGYFSRQSLSVADLLEAGAADVVRVRRHGDTIEERYARQVRVAAGSTVPSLRETSVAVRLSQRLSRRALLTRYVNGMYFGNGVYGVGAASRYYFGQPLTTLGPSQIALLVGVGVDPAHHNPVSAPAAAEQARLDTLAAMRSARLLSPEQAEAAARQAPGARPHEQIARPSAAPDFAALIESSLLARYGEDAVYGQDLHVTTPLDLDLQAALDDSVRRLAPSGQPVLAVATDPRTGDIRALTNHGPAVPGSPQAGADGVLFARRPLGTLAGQLPTVLGDGNSASLGEVAAAFGAVAGGGTRHDLRSLTRVTRPASADGGASVLDAADPLPPGQPIIAPEQAAALTAAWRGAGRHAVPDVPFELAAASGAAGSDAWFVGCVPELCLTVWTGGAGAPGVPAAGTAQPNGPSLSAQVTAATFTAYLAAAPGRISLPPLPAPRTEARRSADLAAPRIATTPSVQAVPTTAPSVAPSLPAHEARRPATPSSPVPTTTATPTPQPPRPTTGAAPPPGNGGGGPQTVAEGSPQTRG